jgi:hypothetical protein
MLDLPPHHTAELIVELPTVHHPMPEGKLDRDLCFDPPGAEVLG